MLESDLNFTAFLPPVSDQTLPEKFTFPFYYQPQPIALLAAEQLQQHLSSNNYWVNYFGSTPHGEYTTGKMFGVLVVKNTDGKLGFLSAFSGTINNNMSIPGFVPAILDIFADRSFYTEPQAEIQQLSATIGLRQNSPLLAEYSDEIKRITHQYQQSIDQHRQYMIAARKHRKLLRQDAAIKADSTSHNTLLKQLAKQSVNDKNQLKNLVQQQRLAIQPLVQKLAKLQQEIQQLQQQRKTLSSALQQKIFDRFKVLNCDDEVKSLTELFRHTPQKQPPAGAGECAAPKLLHYAFQHHLQPVALAEFWWGAPPVSAIRKHLTYYPACIGKCQPILKHMLAGMTLEANPLLQNTGEKTELSIIHQDQSLVIINKPAELLSVPGKHITDSVYSRIKQQFPLASGPLIVHRLDMSTSGLMVIALNKKAHKALQQQFINRTVNKRYVALISGHLTDAAGVVNLALCGDHYDRPRQKVCALQGKPAETEWQVIAQGKINGSPCTQVSLSPKTGRTHQLRVHCAHFQGLNSPIIGDDLYGQSAARLYLHAQTLTLRHPDSKEIINFSCKLPFQLDNCC